MPECGAAIVVREMEDHVASAVKLAGGLSIKERIGYAAQMLGLTVGRAQSYWYGKVRRVDAHEADVVRQRVQRLQHLDKLRREYEAARNDLLAAPASMVGLAPPSIRGGQGTGGAGARPGEVASRASAERRRA